MFREPPPEVAPRTQYGSIEGVLVRVGRNYNVPAILVQERLSGEEIWCHIEDDRQHLISQEANFEDVWANRRVRITGTLNYKAGSLWRVYVHDVSPIAARDISHAGISDPGFTGGIPLVAYIEKLRGGEFE